jgi:hypothetical protein
MKKILLFTFLTILSFCGFSQTYTSYNIAAISDDISIPRYLIGENLNTNVKDTVGIVITLKQAQKINTDYDILALYRGLHKDCDSTVNFLVQVVENYKKTDVIAQSRFKMYDSTLTDAKLNIYNLKEQIAIGAARILVKDSTIAAKDGLINIEKQKSIHFKKQRNRALWIETPIIGVLLVILGHTLGAY